MATGVLEKTCTVFYKKIQKTAEMQVDLDQLYAKIGKLEIERDFLRKNLKKLGQE